MFSSVCSRSLSISLATLSLCLHFPGWLKRIEIFGLIITDKISINTSFLKVFGLFLLFFLAGHQSDFKKSNRKILVPEYDYYSLMHYKTTEFSKDSSRLKTIDIKQRGVDESIVGQREFLSEKDKLRIKLLYGCPTS